MLLILQRRSTMHTNSHNMTAPNPTIILAAGWGFDQRFWQPLAAELAEYEIAYDSRDYFSGVEQSPVSLNKPVLCIGHSYGYARMVEKYKEANNVLGFVSICGFLQFSKSCPQLSEQNKLMQRSFDKSPVTTLKAFYRRCGLREWPHIPNNFALLAHDLECLDQLRLQSPTQPTLAINGTKDFILREKLRKNETIVPNCTETTIDAGHALGYQYPQHCAKHIKRFIYDISPAKDTALLRKS